MKTLNYIVLLVVIIAAAAAGYRFILKKNGKSAASDNLKSNLSTTMKISSPAFENNGNIPPKYTCDGEGVSPQLEISGVSSSAKSLALILHDPDAPAAGGFTHWIIFNMDPTTSVISENSAPPNAVQGQNGTGQAKYASPCPPSGVHHYEFRLYALDTMLNLGSSAKKNDVEKAIEGHIIEQTVFVGLYSHQ